MGGANSVSLPGTHLISDANTHTDPIVRSSKSSLSGKLVVEDANTNLREDSSAPMKIDEDRGHATTIANSVLASLGSDSEHGDQFHKKAKRYISKTFFVGERLSRTLRRWAPTVRLSSH